MNTGIYGRHDTARHYRGGRQVRARLLSRPCGYGSGEVRRRSWRLSASGARGQASAGLAEWESGPNARYRERLLDRPLCGGQMVVAMLFSAQRLAAEDRSEPGGVHELDASHVEHYLLGARSASVDNGLLEHLGRGHVDFSAEEDRMALALDPCVNAKAPHRGPEDGGRLIADGDQRDGLVIAHEAAGAQIALRALVGHGQPAGNASQSQHFFISLPVGRRMPLLG
jgi:hypothetical protein